MEPGSVAEWFAAVGTVGAFIVAIALFVQDRRAKEQELARGLSAWYEERLETAFGGNVEGEEHRYVFTIDVYNSGSKPVVGLNAMGYFDNGEADLLVTESEKRFVQLRPEESATFRYEAQAEVGVQMAVVAYNDGNGVPWRQNLMLRQLSRLDKRNSALWRFVDVRRMNKFRKEQGMKPIKIPLGRYLKRNKSRVGQR